MRRFQWSVVFLTPMIKLLLILVAKVLPIMELLSGLFLLLTPTCLFIYFCTNLQSGRRAIISYEKKKKKVD